MTTRPKFNEEMRLELAKKAAGYLGVSYPDDDDLSIIANELEYHEYDDGYELGKIFEDMGYFIDADTVSELD